MWKVGIFIYGSIVYVIFLGTFLYAVGFVGNVLVPKSIDSGIKGDSGTSLLINVILLSLFAIQHSLMAREGFKKWWTRIIPSSAERSTFVLITSFLLMLLFWQWQPIPRVIWSVGSPLGRFLLSGIYWSGWVIALLSTFMIDHWELFGLRQVYVNLKEKEIESHRLKISGFYQYVRHPIMLGFIIAFWATPHMTLGHLLFAAATTAYIMIGIHLEERDLLRTHGKAYEDYRQNVSMLLPLKRKKESHT